ncbi:MAG: D-alanyl-D-alanine carboxypeptidase family protein, partial [Eubacteriales bacterium]
DVDILLGYRSYSKQRNYFDTTVKDYMTTMTEEQARATASSIVQEAGCNPQQAGLSIVMHNLEDTSTAFSREAAYAWLEENCWKFGYIIRYPADKTAETGMAFQPYFFTYVGRYHAMRIMEQKLSMEEYIAQLNEKNYFGMPYSEFRDKLLNRVNQ